MTPRQWRTLFYVIAIVPIAIAIVYATGATLFSGAFHMITAVFIAIVLLELVAFLVKFSFWYTHRCPACGKRLAYRASFFWVIRFVDINACNHCSADLSGWSRMPKAQTALTAVIGVLVALALALPIGVAMFLNRAETAGFTLGNAGFSLERDEFEIVYDLTDINLYDHDLRDAVFIQHHLLRSGYRYVTGPSGESHTLSLAGRVYGWSWPIALQYGLMNRGSAVDVVRDAAVDEMNRTVRRLGSAATPRFDVSPLRASADYDMAALFVCITGARMPFVSSFHVSELRLYVAQDIPDSDYVLLLDLRILGMTYDGEGWVALLERKLSILRELSEHMGIDLLSPVVNFLSECSSNQREIERILGHNES